MYEFDKFGMFAAVYGKHDYKFGIYKFFLFVTYPEPDGQYRRLTVRIFSKRFVLCNKER